MNKLFLALPLVLCGCATQVYHPTRDHSAMQTDIAACTEASVLSTALNVAVKEDIMACLKEMGYRKGTNPAPAAVSTASAPAAPKAAASKPAAAKPNSKAVQGPAPCVVPCKPK